MPLFLLTPRHLQAPDWKLSTHRKAVQIEAETEEEARQRATLFYGLAAETGAKGFNPWNQSTLVRAKIITEPDPGVPLKRLGDKP